VGMWGEGAQAVGPGGRVSLWVSGVRVRRRWAWGPGGAQSLASEGGTRCQPRLPKSTPLLIPHLKVQIIVFPEVIGTV